MSDFTPIDEALKEIKKGNLIILVDNKNRENEGDFYSPSDLITPQKIMTMIRCGSGLVCCAITEQQAKILQLPLMIPLKNNTEKTHVNFTISVNAKKNVSTGVSAYDRTETIKLMANPKTKPQALTRPGHVFGLVAKNGGVLERDGHTEAAVELAKLAGLNPSGVLCEIVGSDGHMAKVGELKTLAKKLNIKLVSIDDLINFVASSTKTK